MNLVLKSMSQDVDILHPEVIKHFLVVQLESGEDARLPVQEETIQALLKILYGDKAKAAAQEQEVPEVGEEPDEDEISPPPVDDEESDASIFGGSAEPPDDDELPEDDEEPDVPETEEKVPSL